LKPGSYLTIIGERTMTSRLMDYSIPYVFGFVGILWLDNPIYPLWTSVLLIAMMGIATILNIITLIRRVKRRKGKE